jgi:hypothetical protein
MKSIALVQSGLISVLLEPKGATIEAHFISYCRLLPPRPIAKLLQGNKMTGAGDGNRTEHPLNSAMISADFTESRNSPSSHGKWLGSLQRRTATFCRLNNAASTIPTMKCVGWDVG